MSDEKVRARHIRTGRPIEVLWSSGRIVAVNPVDDSPPDLWVAPALVDLQINGFAGVDFQQDNLTVEQLLRAARGLRDAGCTRFLLTLITDEWTKLMARLSHLRKQRDDSSELQNAIAGWHIEGPFLSPEAGYCGAHNPAVMCDPTAEHIRELRERSGHDPVLLTLAPERTGAMAAIAEAVALGIKVSVGHTNASQKQLLDAVKAGAVGFTHLGNALPNELNRFDNLLWRIFETPGLISSLIPDGIHVSPALFRLAHRILGSESIYYTTDAMAAAGAPPGRYRLGALELEVAADRVVRQPGKANFAGSALSPLEGVFRAAELLEREWREVWPSFSETPARLMGLDSGLETGSPADLCLIKVAEANRLQSLQVLAAGAAA
jgi:N-acetylglucosamine-6-phosphate deacetylase